MQYQEIAVSALARREKRSPWAVLDDCACYGDQRELYYNDVLVAYKRGPYITPAICDVKLDACGFACPLGTNRCISDHGVARD
jgi:hypothetical protein